MSQAESDQSAARNPRETEAITRYIAWTRQRGLDAGLSAFMGEQMTIAMEDLRKPDGTPWNYKALAQAIQETSESATHLTTVRRMHKGLPVKASSVVAVANALGLPVDFFAPNLHNLFILELLDPSNRARNAPYRLLLATVDGMPEATVNELAGVAQDLTEWGNDDATPDIDEAPVPEDLELIALTDRQLEIMVRMLHPDTLVNYEPIRRLLGFVMVLKTRADLDKVLSGAAYERNKFDMARSTGQARRVVGSLETTNR